MKIIECIKEWKLKRSIKNTNRVLFEAKHEYAKLFKYGVFEGFYRGVYVRIIFNGTKIVLPKEIAEWVEKEIEKKKED